ncbi:hypothetical protein P4S64_22915 [Vibrio sp. M60_M31a]
MSFFEDHDIYPSADHIADQAQDVDDNYKKTGHISSQTTWNVAAQLPGSMGCKIQQRV